LKGATLLKERKPELAIPVLAAALAIHKAAGDTLATVDTANALGVCYRYLERWADAEATYADAIKVALAGLPPNHFLLGVLFGNLAMLYEKIGNLVEAETALNLSLKTHRAAAQTDQAAGRHLAQAFERLLALYERQGRVRDSVRLLRDELVPDAPTLWRELITRAQAARSDLLRTHRIAVDRFLSNVLMRWPDDPAAAAEVLDVLLWRRGFGLEPYRCANRAAGTNPHLRSQLDQVKAVRAALAAEIFSVPLAPARPHSVKVHLEGIGRSSEVDALEVDVFASLPDHETDRVTKAPEHGAVAVAMPSDAALIEFWRCRRMNANGSVTPRYVALALRATDPRSAKLVDLCDADALEDGLILDFLAALTGEPVDAALPRHINTRAAPQSHKAPTNDDWRSLGSQVRALIFDPLVESVGDAGHLLIVPDGLLARVPFAALPANDGFIIDRYQVSYLSSGRDLCLTAPAGSTAGPPVVLANPAYTLPGTVPSADPTDEDLWFSDLPGAEMEGKRVAARLSVQAVTGESATERYLKECQSPTVLHIATHGAILPVKPLVAELDITSLHEFKVELRGRVQFVEGLRRLSGVTIDDQALRSILACAGVNTWLCHGVLPDEAEDGWLNAEDIAMIDLAGNELTVLSACETALGSIQVGEGVLGLRTAFHVAGARTTVMSLWLVDDDAAPDIMLRFYDHVLEGRGRAKALHLAVVEARKKFPETPALWGSFVCQGDPGPLSPRQLQALLTPPGC
jgi:CHAT domain-containing protein/tetratricopeptide (TPR) repeat protein